MMTKTAIELVNFEDEITNLYNQGKIKSPVHLSGGNEKQLIKIFKKVKKNDWIFTTYRSHYHALLKGMPKEELKQWILENKSIHLMSKKYKIVTSAIVGGTLSQAVGCALAIKKKGVLGNNYPMTHNVDLGGGVIGTKIDVPHIWCFCGDMTASLGVFNDCWKYAVSNNLPITFVIEDNGLSTDTPTKEAWNFEEHPFDSKRTFHKIIYYKYERTRPHYGTNETIAGSDGKRKIDLNKT